MLDIAIDIRVYTLTQAPIDRFLNFLSGWCQKF